ncbi:NAD(P)/FAD-dependent oxidoreductase [Phenylobacterium montanum]|uniref:FAD-binding oxidoreductase n=1 Tax=Phenylobacterium montanum TaxID=2823693 RepID=A0A975IW63_9CAUL|nr:FAD-binding oxidoreductase [Caulobacter sp. S6]QUD89279.1 FAD-binding oxidoreductase [Caulobacter sp. S6]
MALAGDTHGLWSASAPPAPPTRPLDDHRTADFVIVGAGYTGLSAALHLAERKASVVVLEAQQIGAGGSGRNVGLVNAGLWLPPDEVLAALPEPFGERLIEQLGNAPELVFDLIAWHDISCEARRSGTLHCAVGAAGLKELQAREQQWRRRGAPVQLLNASQTRERIGGGDYAGSLLDRRAGTIQPLAYARGLAAAAIRAGARLHAYTPVLSRTAECGAWKLTTALGSVSAPVVLLATNAYSEGPFADLQRELVRLPYFNLATAPLSQALRRQILPGGEGCWDTPTLLSSFRLDAAGRLVFGSVGALRGAGSAIHRHWSRRALARIFPELRDISFDYAWYGQIGMTPDAIPRLHRPDDGVFAVGGYNGRGIAPGTSFGRELARLALGETAVADLALPLSNLARARFRTVQEAYYEAGASLAHLVAERL